MPRLYIISGCNGSGKTTASYSLLPELLECSEFVNSDEFAKHLSPFAPESAYITASRFMMKKIAYLFDRRADFCLESTLATRSLIKMVRKAQSQGYFVTVLYFWLNSPDMAVARVAKRVAAGGHDIPEETIRRRYRVGLSYLFHDYMPACDKWMLADNSDPPYRLVAEGTRKGLVIKDLERYETIRQMVDDSDEGPGRIEETLREIAVAAAKAPVGHDGVPAIDKPND